VRHRAVKLRRHSASLHQEGHQEPAQEYPNMLKIRTGKLGNTLANLRRKAKVHQYRFVQLKEKLDITEALVARL
jgi:hypothetical protein